jgi:hypothetical protein
LRGEDAIGRIVVFNYEEILTKNRTNGKNEDNMVNSPFFLFPSHRQRRIQV